MFSRRLTLIILAAMALKFILVYSIYPYILAQDVKGLTAILKSPSLDSQHFEPQSGRAPSPLIPGLLAAPWAGSWPLSILSADPEGPALVMLHIFSWAKRSARRRRDLIRKYHPLFAVPAPFRHLVEVKFVLGDTKYGEDQPEWDDEATLEDEQREYGDLLRLKGLRDGENMGQGKTWDWLRQIGRPRGREAWWVIKCDDDTIPIMPNLMDWLWSLDPAIPTYFGKPRDDWENDSFYMQGMIYGLSWGIVKSLAAANVTREEIEVNYPEDARIGELIASLPARPEAEENGSPFSEHRKIVASDGYLPKGLISRLFDSLFSQIAVSEPDPRTGTVAFNTARRMGNHDDWWMWFIGAKRAFAWHNYKSDALFESDYLKVLRRFAEAGRPWSWEVPKSMDALAMKM